jgi:hypothetical protein
MKKCALIATSPLFSINKSETKLFLFIVSIKKKYYNYSSGTIMKKRKMNEEEKHLLIIFFNIILKQAEHCG